MNVSAAVSVAFSGVYVKAVVMSEADNERIAVNGLVPCLFKVNTLVLQLHLRKQCLKRNCLYRLK